MANFVLLSSQSRMTVASPGFKLAITSKMIERARLVCDTWQPQIWTLPKRAGHSRVEDFDANEHRGQCADEKLVLLLGEYKETYNTELKMI